MSAGIEWKSNPLSITDNPVVAAKLEPTNTGSGGNSSSDPDQEQNRLIIDKHSSMKCRLLVDAPYFSAPGSICGRLDLQNTASDNSPIKIRSIVLELIGSEEVKDPKAPADSGRLRRAVFLKQAITLQAPESPPSDAVMASEMPDQAGYRNAKPGLSQFPFVFDLSAATAETLPGSFAKQNNRIVYELVASIWLRDGKAASILKTRLPINVYPTLSSLSPPSSAVQTAGKSWGLFSGKGAVNAQAVMDRTRLVAGFDAFVRLRIDNQSARRVSRVRLDLVRRLKTYRRPEEGEGEVEVITFKKRTVQSRLFPGNQWDFDGCAQRELILALPIPSNYLSVNRGRLLDCSYSLQVTVSAKFSKSITIEFPLEISHQSAINCPPSPVQLRLNRSKLYATTKKSTPIEQTAKSSHLQLQQRKPSFVKQSEETVYFKSSEETLSTEAKPVEENSLADKSNVTLTQSSSPFANNTVVDPTYPEIEAGLDEHQEELDEGEEEAVCGESNSDDCQDTNSVTEPIDGEISADEVDGQHESADEMNADDSHAVLSKQDESITQLREQKAKEIMADVKDIEQTIDEMFAEFDQVNAMWPN